MGDYIIKRILLVAGFIILLVLSYYLGYINCNGCRDFCIKGEIKEELVSIPSEGTINNISYKIVSCSQYNKSNRGYYIGNIAGRNTYIITSGQRSTGGYTIQIKNIKVYDKDVIVQVFETGPDATDVVTQAITYPAVCIQFDQELDSFKVEGFPNLSNIN